MQCSFKGKYKPKGFELHPASIWFMVCLGLGFLLYFLKYFDSVDQKKEWGKIAFLVYLEKVLFMFLDFKNMGQYCVRRNLKKCYTENDTSFLEFWYSFVKHYNFKSLFLKCVSKVELIFKNECF